MNYNNDYQIKVAQERVADLIEKNVNLRRDFDELLTSNKGTNALLKDCVTDLHAALELNRSLSASIARLVVENHKLESELEKVNCPCKAACH